MDLQILVKHLILGRSFMAHSHLFSPIAIRFVLGFRFFDISFSAVLCVSCAIWYYTYIGGYINIIRLIYWYGFYASLKCDQTSCLWRKSQYQCVFNTRNLETLYISQLHHTAGPQYHTTYKNLTYPIELKRVALLVLLVFQ